jgi:HD-like signal output (HDOD) protein
LVANHPVVQEAAWKIKTVKNGDEALTALKNSPFDISIANLSLPKKPGDILLAHTKRDYPNSLRFLIHEPGDTKSLQKGTGLAHRYLEKPITPERLVQSVDEVLRTQLRIRRKEVVQIISDTKELHINTRPMQELLMTADNPNCDINDLVPVISQHPTAVATILQVANTAFFGAGGRIETIAEAIQMLGMDFVRNLSISELAKKQLSLPPGLQEIANAVLKHSIDTSQCGLQMRKFDVSVKQVQTLSSLALLHDLGKLVLLKNKGDDYADIMGRSIENNRPCWRLEQALFGCDHAAIGAFLFAMWGLPENIIRAVAWHHEPLEFPSNEFSSISLLHLANCAAHIKNEMPFYFGDELNPEIVTTLGLPKDFIKELD